MKDNKKKIFIEALEQRIMLDGAGASTALDVIDERNKEQLLNKNQKISKLSEKKMKMRIILKNYHLIKWQGIKKGMIENKLFS